MAKRTGMRNTGFVGSVPLREGEWVTLQDGTRVMFGSGGDGGAHAIKPGQAARSKRKTTRGGSKIQARAGGQRTRKSA